MKCYTQHILHVFPAVVGALHVVKLSVFMSSVTVEIEQCLLKVSYL